MKPADLDYSNLVEIIKPFTNKGLPESAAFLNWFLEHIFRLDDVQAHDCVCDSTNDKGVDGIYVDDFEQRIVVFQSKIRQKAGGTLGDVALKEFAGTLSQFSSVSSIDLLLNGTANAELKKLIQSLKVRDRVAKGYIVEGNFVTNQEGDHNTSEYLAHNSQIKLFNRSRIAEEYVELSLPDGINDTFIFSCDESPICHKVSNLATLYLFAASASDLVRLPGISDATLFAQNVRFSLGNTDVNKAIAKTIKDRSEHKKFPLFHNGVTLLCDKAELVEGNLSVSNFVVVNGAQSLTALYQNRHDITSDLRFLLRVIEVSGNEDLARQITLISNNQNAIKPRDLRSNHQLQVRLKSEFNALNFENYTFEIKRGEVHPAGSRVITNEEAGRLLLAFDLSEPWSCHQIYKVFDDLYSRIFGRPEVTAERVILLTRIMELVQAEMGTLENRPFASYTLTRFFLLDVIAQILRDDSVARGFLVDPAPLYKDPKLLADFEGNIAPILKGIIADVNFEISEQAEMFDYKSLLKNQQESLKLAKSLMATFRRDVARAKADTFTQVWHRLSTSSP